MADWIAFNKLTLSYFFIAMAAFVATQSLYALLSKPLVRRLELNRRMKMILNEYRLLPFQKESQALVAKQMEEFLFGDTSSLPPGFVPETPAHG